MKNHTKVLAGLGVGAITTLVLATGMLKPTVKLTALATLISVPIIGVANELIQSRADKKIKALESKVTLAQKDTQQLAITISDNDKLSQHLVSLKSELSQIQSQVVSLKSENHKLEESCKLIYGLSEKLKSENQELSEQIAHYEETYSDELSSEVQERVEEYIADDRAKLDAKYRSALIEGQAIHAEAVAIAKAYEQWATQVAERHSDRRDYILGLTKEFNHHIEGAEETWKTERGHLETQIDILEKKVLNLQYRLAGDYTEPLFLDCRFAIPGQIANELAKIIWKGFSIPLAAKGAQQRSNGLIEIGYAYNKSQAPGELVELLNRHSDSLAKELGVHKITSIREHDLTPSIIVGLRREPEVNKDTVKLLAGSPEEFIKYLKSNPWRYRLIAKPGNGKTPTTAVMVSQFLKSGMTMGNTGKGRKIPHSYVVVSCPDVMSSQKDIDYPLQPFLKYGDTTAANKSFQDVEKEWKYRKQNTQYAQDISYLMVWDELDNTIKNSSNPKATGEYLVELLRQAHHTGMGWIASGQSVMTSLIPGFKDDDRDLFTEIVIGTGKIRMYLEKYGKKILPDYSVKNLASSLALLEPYIEEQNNRIVDTARELRLALVLDAKSPKLFFLPNLDNVEFDYEAISIVSTKISSYKGQNESDRSDNHFDQTVEVEAESLTQKRMAASQSKKSKSTIGGEGVSGQKPTCPHCGSTLTGNRSDKRMDCKSCDKRISFSKIVFK